MNISGLLSAVKNHELVILGSKELRGLLGIKRLSNDVINELSEELNPLGFVLIPIRYGSRHNGLTDVRKAVIIRKTTYFKIIRERDMYSMVDAIIDYVMSNKQLFEVNVRNNNGVLKLPTSIIRRILRYIGLSNNYLDTHMNSLVLLIKTILTVNECEVRVKRAMGRMGSVIYMRCEDFHGKPRVPEAGEGFKTPPAKTEAGEEHVGNGTNPRSNPKPNPGTGEIREDKEEDPNHEEQPHPGTGHNGTVGTTAGVRTNVGRKRGRSSYTEVQNCKGGWEGTK